MILADEPGARAAALDALLPLQQGDFEGLFEEMRGLPVTIRLLDPPLHEFLPARVELELELAAMPAGDARRGEVEHLLVRVKDLAETNPMLGTRGARLGMLHPEIYAMQCRAIFRAAAAVRDRSGEAPHLEVMIPLVAYERELATLRELVEHAAHEQGYARADYSVGTMIELPRACIIADRIARMADFFSFGTNDLTQTTLGFSRDDIEGKILETYLADDVFDRSPFETIDTPGVGALVRMGATLGRRTRPDLTLGVCGEHGGDPDSIAFFDEIGMDYVSCSPFRVPVARVAAAQAAVRRAS
jgi:pyruvate,orthophosphate dikinase